MTCHYLKHNLCLMLCTYYCLAGPKQYNLLFGHGDLDKPNYRRRVIILRRGEPIEGQSNHNLEPQFHSDLCPKNCRCDSDRLGRRHQDYTSDSPDSSFGHRPEFPWILPRIVTGLVSGFPNTPQRTSRLQLCERLVTNPLKQCSAAFLYRS